MSSRLQNILQKHFIWIIVLLGVLPFLFALDIGFLSDDWEFLYHADSKPFTFERMILRNTHSEVGPSSYRPMVNVFWGVGYQLFGTEPLGYRIIILLFYIFSTYFLYQIIRRLKAFGEHREYIALGAAAFFALNPVRVAPLAWIAIVNDTMLVFALLASWYCFVRALDATEKRTLWYVGSLLLFAIGMGSKEVAIVFPAVIGATVLLHRLRTTTGWKQWLHACLRGTLAALPYFAIIFGYFLLRYHATGGLITEDYTGASFSFFNFHTMRAYISMPLAAIIIDPLRIPITQAFFHNAGWVLVGIIYVLSGTLIYAKKRTNQMLWILLPLVLISLFPAARFGVNFLSTYASAEGERYVYYPAIFIGIFLAWIIIPKIMRQKNHKILLIAGFVLFTTYSYAGSLPKLAYWQAASVQAEAIAEHTAEKLQTEQSEQVLFLGLPDQFHGAYVWRNAFTLRLFAFDDVPFAYDDLPFGHLRTVVGEDTQFEVSRLEDGMYRYYESSRTPYIVGAPEFSGPGYAVKFSEFAYEKWSIGHTHYTSESIIDLSTLPAGTAVYIFDGQDDWHIAPTVVQ